MKLSPEAEKVKEKLENFIKGRDILRGLEAHKARLERDYTGNSKSSPVKISTESKPNSYEQEQRLIKIDELAERIDKMIKPLLIAEDEFIELFAQLNKKDQHLFSLRYFEGRTYEQIAKDAAGFGEPYCERHVYRLYNDLYEDIAKNKTCQ